jgi:hypothetical protein
MPILLLHRRPPGKGARINPHQFTDMISGSANQVDMVGRYRAQGNVKTRAA